jgi:hypothetical protein
MSHDQLVIILGLILLNLVWTGVILYRTPRRDGQFDGVCPPRPTPPQVPGPTGEREK